LDEAEVGFFAALQKVLWKKRKLLPRRVARICAADAAYDGDNVVAVASVFENGRLAERSFYSGRCSLPYLSGLFYLREGPFVVEAVRRLKKRPQLVCFDAHGAAHPRSAGMAMVCGMVLGIPSVGIAKSLLVGKISRENGDLDRIVYNGRTVGVVTDADGVRKYWSAGYSVSLEGLKSIVRRHGMVCLKVMAESDQAARERMRVEREARHSD
jgi:deoxyribonuclease V